MYYGLYKGKRLISVGVDKYSLKQRAYQYASFRVTFQGIDKDWHYMDEKGFRISKVKIIEI